MMFNYEPDISEADISSVVECLKIGIANPAHIKKFENNLRDIFSINALCCSSGTSALHMSLLSLGIGKGDEVICPDFTFASSWNSIIYTGAKPVFVDICPSTWCIDPELIEAKINKNTKAILSVDLFGNPCDYNKINSICKKYDIKLIQDCAESLGSTYNNKSVFCIGDIACTSFNLNKIITSCGGGAVFSADKNLLHSIDRLRNQNKKNLDYDYHEIGFNYRLGSLNAVIANNQLKRIKHILDIKNKITKNYKKRLESNAITFQKIQDNSTSNNWANVVKFQSKKIRDSVFNRLCIENIEAKRTFKPGSSIEWVKSSYNVCSNHHSNNLFDLSLNLPSSTKLKERDIDLICKIILETINE